jgi:hypothetical protein
MDPRIESTDGHPVSQVPNLSRGLVAWVDVLGFRRLLSADEQNVYVWLEVLNFLNSARKIPDLHKPTDYQTSDIGLRADDYKFTAFADTIVTSVDLSGAGSDHNKELHWIDLFLIRNAYLCRRMFEFGLPIRGGIAFGRFYHSTLGFAGKPFVEAECLSSTLELSACVLSHECVKHLEAIFEGYPQFMWSNKYDCPVKGRPGNRVLHVLNWWDTATLKTTHDRSEFQCNFSSANLDELVPKKFSAHGKRIDDDSVKRKISNTIKLFETVRANDELFS